MIACNTSDGVRRNQAHNRHLFLGTCRQTWSTQNMRVSLKGSLVTLSLIGVFLYLLNISSDFSSVIETLVDSSIRHNTTHTANNSQIPDTQTPRTCCIHDGISRIENTDRQHQNKTQQHVSLKAFLTAKTDQANFTCDGISRLSLGENV